MPKTKKKSLLIPPTVNKDFYIYILDKHKL